MTSLSSLGDSKINTSLRVQGEACFTKGGAEASAAERPSKA